MGEGTMGGCQGWVRGPWGVVRQRCTVNRYRYRRHGKKLFTVTENLTILPVKSVGKQLGTVLVLRNESFI